MRLVLVALTLCVCLVGCDGFTSVAGRVVDPKNAPLKDAEVILLAPGEGRSCSNTTRGDGSYNVGFTHEPARFDLAFVVSKDGFKTHVELIRSSAVLRGYTIVLTPRQPPPKSR